MAEIQMALIGTMMLFYAIMWIAVNLQNDKKTFNVMFILYGLMQMITICMIG
jgi:hypothetical protein